MNCAIFFAFWPAPPEIFFSGTRNIPPWFAKVRIDSNNMGTGQRCSTCGKALEANAPGGLCPECLIKVGLGSGVDPGAGTKTGASRRDFVPPPVEKLGPLFPQLEILEFIGKGGMGAVYKARQKELDRIVALKVLPPDVGQDAAFAERFTREARALAKLNHPGIVTLYEFGRANGLYFFLMEYVDGVNLRRLLAGGRVSAREALAIVPQICDALQYAHDQGIVHRDIKPENILLDRRGRVKVADFGVAKIIGNQNEEKPSGGESAPASSALSDASKVMGTPQYMSPEQISAPGEVDHRADIYALGVVFYQMLTGELPGKQIEPPSRKVKIDVRLDEVVLRALEQKPELRYQQASEVKTIVETIAQTPEAERMPQFSEKHHRAPWSQGLVLASLLCTGACLWPAFELFKQGSGSSFLVGSLLVALTIMCALFAIRGYTITADAILIHRLFWATRLPLAGLKSARFEIAATRWGIRAGNGGFFSCTGFRCNRSLGFHRVFVTDGARTVVLRYPHRIVVVSPADPEAFVRDLANLPSQPSRKQERTMQTMNNKKLWIGSAIGVMCVALAVVLVAFRIGSGHHELTVEAFIDSSDVVKVSGNRLWFEHETGTLPGRNIFVNGKAWSPSWTNNVSTEFVGLNPAFRPHDPQKIQITKRVGRGTVSVAQFPSRANDETLAVRFDDVDFGGADWYEVVISW